MEVWKFRGLNLNDSQYGAQFKAFVDFAAGQRDQGTIVRLEGEEQGMPMPGPNGSPFMRTLKKNIFMNLTLLNVVPKAYPLFRVIDEYDVRLRTGDDMENLLDVIHPVVKRSTIGRRAIYT